MGTDETEDKNLWSQMLKKARQSARAKNLKSETSTLYIVGNPQSGKTSLLNHWKDRISSKTDIPELILDYSYVNVKNKFDLTTEEILSRMGIWTINDDSHAELLPNVACDPHHAAFVICLDLSEPHSILVALKKWLSVFKKTSTTLLGTYSDELKEEKKASISKYVQTFEDKTAEKEEEKKEEEKKEEEKKKKKKEEKKEKKKDPAAKEIAPAIPANNFGIPLFIVGL